VGPPKPPLSRDGCQTFRPRFGRLDVRTPGYDAFLVFCLNLPAACELLSSPTSCFGATRAMGIRRRTYRIGHGADRGGLIQFNNSLLQCSPALVIFTGRRCFPIPGAVGPFNRSACWPSSKALIFHSISCGWPGLCLAQRRPRMELNRITTQTITPHHQSTVPPPARARRSTRCAICGPRAQTRSGAPNRDFGSLQNVILTKPRRSAQLGLLSSLCPCF